ncbi:hypothetical protein KM043_006868 [Ampulex compressa]|nr:hypothetical protein KM043_006868 [Ampulex compressa]
MLAPISEPDGNTRGRYIRLAGASVWSVLRGTGQIAGNYFMVNGRVMHLPIINSAMERICAGPYRTGQLPPGDPICAPPFPISVVVSRHLIMARDRVTPIL